MAARVADASVLAAIAFGEPRAEEGVALLEGAVLHEPTLLPDELASVARRKILSHPDRAEAIAQALGLALALEIRWVEVDHRAVLRLALEEGLTTYDAAYLHLARKLDAPLVTFDDRLRDIAGVDHGQGSP